MTALGNDVTRFFNIENRSNTIVFRADSNFLKTDEAYNNVTYYFRIKVQAGSNQEIDSHNHYQRSNEFMRLKIRHREQLFQTGCRTRRIQISRG
mgnify:CR=1 FL=1